VWHAGIAVASILLLNKNGIANWRVAISYYVQPLVGVDLFYQFNNAVLQEQFVHKILFLVMLVCFQPFNAIAKKSIDEQQAIAKRIIHHPKVDIVLLDVLTVELAAKCASVGLAVIAADVRGDLKLPEDAGVLYFMMLETYTSIQQKAYARGGISQRTLDLIFQRYVDEIKVTGVKTEALEHCQDRMNVLLKYRNR